MRTVICDLEADGLRPTKIWIIVCKDAETGDVRTFKELDTPAGRASFLDYAERTEVWVGHNFLGYDRLAIESVLGYSIPWTSVIDTLVVSRLLDATLVGKKPHSLEAWAERLGKRKAHAGIEDWSRFTPEMEERCLSDAEINYLLFKRFHQYIYSPKWRSALRTEHFIAHHSTILHANGFAFDIEGAKALKDHIDAEVSVLTSQLQDLFPPRTKFICEVTPRATKHGTINRSDFRWLGPNPDLSPYSVGASFSRFVLEPFNPGSAPQRIDRLWEAGWKPTDKTDGHKEAEKTLRTLQRLRRKSPTQRDEIAALQDRLERYKIYGWKTSEENLNTLPDTAPEGVKSLVRWMLLANRSSTLQTWFDNCRIAIQLKDDSTQNFIENETWKNLENTTTITTNAGIVKISDAVSLILNRRTVSLSKILTEWLQSREANVKCVSENGHSWSIIAMPPEKSGGCSVGDVIQLLDGLKPTGIEYSITSSRVHGTFSHIGAWTHRMSHDRPNMGNIPKFDSKQPDKTPYSDRMRALWCAAPNRYLIGVDADSIQLRILAHYINDPEFTAALISGKKEDGTDPHSVNQRALGNPCKSRDDAKTFIYAWLLGAGIRKVAEILGCSLEEAEEAVANFINRYPGLKYVKEEIIPFDAERGYFEGFDGRFVKIWGDDLSSRRHFALAGYLQNGEVTIMKRASELWYPKLELERVPFWWVNFVHDEYQTETIRDLEVATYVATTQADAIRQVGVDLGLNCPMAGSILNGHGKIAIGDNWMETH